MLSVSLNKTFPSLLYLVNPFNCNPTQDSLLMKTDCVACFISDFNIKRRKEGNGLFNDTLNTFYLRFYGTIHMVKDHSDSERGNPLLPHALPFLITARFFLYASSHRKDNTHHGLCYASRGALAGTRNCSIGPP